MRLSNGTRLNTAPSLPIALILGVLAVAPRAAAQEDAVLVAPPVVLPDVVEIMRAAVEREPNEAELAPHLALFRPLLKMELSFANRVCKLTDEQRTAAIADSKVWLLGYARDYAKQQGQPQNVGAWMAAPRGARNANANPLRSIEEGVVVTVKKHLKPEQAAQYDAELAKRREFHQQAAAENLVAAIDEKLFLSADQRQKITNDLNEHWDDSWGVQLENLVHMGNYLPQVPDKHVVQHLNADQRSVWNGIQKVHFGPSFGNEQNWIGGQAIDDINLN